MSGGTFQKRALDAAVFLIVVAAILHFAHRAVQGGSGLFVRMAVEKEYAALSAEKAALEAERARYANLALRLSADHLDLDLLDEEARRVLGHMRADEVVVR